MHIRSTLIWTSSMHHHTFSRLCYTHISQLTPALRELVLLLQSLTCVLSELVHGLQVYDVRRESAVHLAEDHAPSAGVAAPDGRLYLVGDGGAVGPPPAVFVQPFPHHHGGGQQHVASVGPGEDTDTGA